MQFSIKKVDGNLSEINNTPKSSFVSETTTRIIELNYNYKDEPNNGRVQLTLEFTINKESVLE
jgi:hypothetical protein